MYGPFNIETFTKSDQSKLWLRIINENSVTAFSGNKNPVFSIKVHVFVPFQIESQKKLFSIL